MTIEKSIEQLFQEQAKKFDEGQDKAVRAELAFNEPDYGRFAAYSFGLISLLKPWRLSHLFRVVHKEGPPFPATLKTSNSGGEHVVLSVDHLAKKIEEIMQSEVVEKAITDLLR